jgi:IPT/TIG domain
VATTFMAADQLRALAPPHSAGPVDVVVTSVDGQSIRRVDAFTYVPPPPLALNYLSPDTGSTSGGTGLFISGVSFQSGGIVTVDGVPAGAHFNGGAGYFLTTEPHAAGPVQIVVTNPDGVVSNPLTYTFAPPESFDFNGTWESYSEETEEPNFVFTIQNNQLMSMTCRGAAPITFATPPAIVGGAFGFTLADGSRMAGRIVAPDSARGDMNVVACGPLNWVAYKRR